MVFEVAGEIFEKEFAERHAESVAQNSRLSSGAKSPILLALYVGAEAPISLRDMRRR